jgi:dimethylamine/trimethylamine dehydrogenase
MGEEWRKGWHPERVAPRTADDAFLVIGAGPAGLECARILGQRGHAVHLVDAAEQLGGRVTRETRLPGLAAWSRVRDYRLGQINKMAGVSIVRGSPVSAHDILEFGARRVVLATGARWRGDGVGRANHSPIPGLDAKPTVLTPEDVMDGRLPQSPALVFDDDHYYLGGVIAEKLRSHGIDVVLVTPAGCVSAWTVNTLEQFSIQKRLLELGVTILANCNLVEFDGQRAAVECVFTGRRSIVPAGSVVTVTSRVSEDALAAELARDPDRLAQAGIVSVVSIGDCLAPSTIAAAVYAGHRYAREFDRPLGEDVGFARELPAV